MKKIEIDDRCPDDIVRELVIIADQCAKNQYWNAISRTNILMKLLLAKFDSVLKRGHNVRK